MVRKLLLIALAALASAPAAAQGGAAQVVVVPPFAFQANKATSAGDVGAIAHQAAELVTADLRSSGDLVPLGPEGQARYVYAEVTAPRFSIWRKTGAKALVTGFVTPRDDGRIAVGCYVYDIAGGREIGRQGVVVPAGEWRRAAHRCADTAYAKLTGRRGGFDTRIAYVAETGSAITPIKRVAVMDADGSNHKYLTAGDTTTVTPRLSPDGALVAFVSFSGGQPHVRLLDLDSDQQRPLAPQGTPSFAPRFSPDGRTIAFSMVQGGNADIYIADVDGGVPRRLTTAPGVDTSPAFSPDGGRILFESDRSGSQQLYVMDADGSDQRRISFGPARYASPSWSGEGDLVAFTRISGEGLRIGVMTASGADERVLTTGPFDESPSWAPNSRNLLFSRWTPAGARNILTVSTGGGEPRRTPTPQGGSDADWSAGAGQ